MLYRVVRKFLLILIVFNKAALSTKWLIDNPGFNDPAAWIDEYLPCAREDVIFPEKYQGLLPLPVKVNVGGFVLPKDGAILIQQDSIITLGGDSRERDCDKGKAYIKAPTIHKWFDPNTWRSSKEQSTNKAIPDMDKVPCNNESVVIKSNGALAFDLENAPYLRLGQLSFSGSLLSKNYLKELLNTDLGQFLFKNQEGVNIEYYHNDVCGCHKEFNTFNEPICHNIIDSCERPHCLVPVVPYGSCCAICGSVVRFNVEYCENDKLHILKDILEKSLVAQDLKEDLDYYVNYINSQNYGNFLQAIIVDRNGYNEKSVQFMKNLNSTTNWSNKLKLDSKQIYKFEYSGRPYNPNITFGSVVLILLCFIFVSMVALVIFAHYSPDNHYLRYVPRWIYDPRLLRTFVNRRNDVFARFDNTRASIGTMTTEANTKQGFTMGYDAESGRVREQAFDNPMFGEVPSTSRAAREVKSEDGRKDVPKEVPKLIIESVDMVDNSDDEEEQELTEIKLEASSTDDDDEQETKE